MKKIFELYDNGKLFNTLVFGVLLIGIWATFFNIDNGFYQDPFHHGEFVATLPLVLNGNANFFTIHGAMDWIPAWIAQYFLGIDRHFLPTMLIYSLMDGLASVFLFHTAVLLIHQQNKYRPILLMLSAALVVTLVGARDVFLIIAFWIFTLTNSPGSRLERKFLELLLGLALAFNLFWSFDRGVAGFVGIGFSCLILAVVERRHLISIASFVVALLSLHWIGALSFPNYFANFKFLMETSSQWSYGLMKAPVILIVLVAIPNVWAIYYLLKQLHFRQKADWGRLSNIFSLITLTILMFKIGVNRADGVHVMMALWMPALSLLYLHEKLAVKFNLFFDVSILISIVFLANKAGNPWLYLAVIALTIYGFQKVFVQHFGHFDYQKLSLVVAIVLLLGGMLRILAQYTKDDYQWMLKVASPPINATLVGEDVKWVASEFLKAESGCIFDLSNHGVINGLTGLPACTKYIYPVYANKAYEADMLARLQQHQPPLIVFSSTHWSFSIDGKSMHERFPTLKNYLLKSYPYEKCRYGYCLRYTHPLN
ncbi:MAG: hypothetical protein HOP21_09845 [Methylotenera sp.]|nr:hypothetical protein [Methylotenera sp.]